MDFRQVLNRLAGMENTGCIDEALMFANTLLEAYPDEQVVILLEKAKLEFRNGHDKEALIDFIQVYELSGDKEIYEFVLAAYYEPNRDELAETYYRNTRRLEEYPHYRNLYKDDVLEFVPIWQDEELLIFANIFNKHFGIFTRKTIESMPGPNDIYMMANILWLQDILKCEKCSGIKDSLFDDNLPMYVVYENVYWMLFTQLNELDLLMDMKRIVFLVGIQSFYEYLHEEMVLFPNTFCCDADRKDYCPVIYRVIEEVIQENQKNRAEMEQYYTMNETEIVMRLKKRKQKILFWTCRFTSVLKYHIRDCMEAAERLGYKTKLLIEKSGIHRIGQRELFKMMVEFKPDIIFAIDHFRFENPDVPQNAIWITWIQDPMPYVMDKATPAKLGEKDFVMSHYTTWKEFKKIPYKDSHLIEAPVPANSFIYKPYLISEEEYKLYSCDICFVCHGSDVDEYIDRTIRKIPAQLREAVTAIFRKYHSCVYEKENILFTKEELVAFVLDSLAEQGAILSQEILVSLIDCIYYEFNQRVYRQAMVDWILDAGFTNIKLWGNGWSKEAKYRKYAMGPAKNGETLSKIYQASKIVVGNNIMTTAAARAWETMLSGGFYLSNYIPEGEDATDIRRILEVDKDVIMFYNREDLINKLHYYLENEDERQKMIQRGRTVALEKMTYDALMKKVMFEVAERLEEGRNE